MKRPVATGMVLLGVSILVLFFLNLLLGSVSVPAGQVWKILWGGEVDNTIWQNIILKSRFPQALTALVAGAGLSVAGLQMQTVFRNPLAGPSVLGVSSGASLGVAFVVLLSGRLGGVALSRLGYMGELAMTVSAIIGAIAAIRGAGAVTWGTVAFALITGLALLQAAKDASKIMGAWLLVLVSLVLSAAEILFALNGSGDLVSSIIATVLNLIAFVAANNVKKQGK